MDSQQNRFISGLSIKFFALSFLLFSFLSAEKSVYAQGNIRIIHKQQHEAKSDSYLGRDVWFAIPQNFTSGAQKYFNIYVNSPRNTTVNFQVGGGPVIKKPVTAGKVAIFTSPTPTKPSSDLSVTTEIGTSGVVETKSVHVWSNDADIAVYFLSRVPYSSGGMYVLPPTGWGTDYIVGAYESIFDPSGQADWPSEFALVANQDNTIVTITPTWDIRKDQFPSVIEHPKGQTFTVNLNKGECVQYQTVLPINDGECDLTGTIVKSNNPVGVMAGSVDPYIPFPYGYGDYCLSMLQPVRTWSDTYFTSPFAGRKYGGDVYCVIGTKAQTIKRNGTQIALLNFYGDHYFIYDDIAASPAALWTSDAPFELMQYIPSATFGTGKPNSNTRNEGDADMCSINPADQFGKKVYFQTPTIDLASGQTEFTNYVNILLPANHETATTYDGLLLSSPALPPNIAKRERFPIPNTSWEAMRLTYKPNSGEGSHLISSDTGVGVYLYGYGTDDSYSWAGSLGTRTHNDPDTVPPVAIAGGPCFCAHVRIYDTGPGQSKLSSFVSDSSFNMTFNPDPNFIPGAGQDSSYYDLCVIDSTLPAYLSVSVFDIAGNRTTVISTYQPQFVKFSPDPLNFGTVNVGNSKSLYDTVCNTGQNPFNFKSANLIFSNGKSFDNLGFSIDSTGADGPIPVGGCRVIKLTYASKVPPTVKDTMTLVDECVKIPVPVIGNGGAPDFDIADYLFDCTTLNANRQSINYGVTNPSGIPIQVDSVWLDPNPNFTYDKVTFKAQNQLPFVVPALAGGVPGDHVIIVTFNPLASGQFKTNIHVIAKGVQKEAVITGLACAPNIVSLISTATTNCSNPYSFRIPIQNTGTYFDSVISVNGSNNTGFSKVKIEDPLGNALTTPTHIDSGKVIYATVLYTPPGGASGCFTDSIVVTSTNEAAPFVTYVTVCVKHPVATVTNKNVDLGPFPFGGVKGQGFFEVCNTGQDSLTISSIDSLPPFHSSSFSLSNIYKVGGVAKTFPIVLAAKECLDVYVNFNPSVNIANQQDSFEIASNTCQPGDNRALVIAEVKNGVPSVQGFSDPPLFSCDVRTDTVKFTNPNVVASTITAVNIGGKDKANFSSLGTVPINVPGNNTTIGIPILFTPTQQSGLMNYTAFVILTVNDGAGNTRLDTAIVTAIGQGMDLTVTSKFANPVSKAGTPIDLPIFLSIDKHGLAAPLTDLDIRRIELTYNYNTNLLDIYKGDIKNAVKISDSALWSVDLATSKITPGVLQLNLVGTAALRDIDIVSTFGTITFIPSIPQTGSSTNVTLATSNFVNSAAQPIPNCTQVARLDSNFSLSYECGDSSLQRFMNGQLIMSANPVTPNPTGSGSGQVLNFKYASRIPGAVSLTIYDELGKEVAHVIDYQNMPAGMYEVRFNASGLTEGTYIYRYTLNNTYVMSGRVIIQK